MSKRFGSIALPLQLVKQQQFSKKIQQIDLNLTSNTLYLKSFIQKNHEICHNSTKQLTKLISATQRKINSTKRQQQYFQKFLNNLLEINKCMEKQISKVMVVLNSKRNEEIHRINQVISGKLGKVGEAVGIFVNMVREYNQLDQKYVKKSEYYIDFENNPIKYYSLTKNQEKYQKIRKIQQELEQKLEDLSIFKGEIRAMMVELSVKISQLYENVRLKIEQFRKASRTVLQKMVQMIKGFDKIEQASQRAQQESEYLQKQSSFSRMRDSFPARKQLKQIKKQKITEYEQQTNFKMNILAFISNFMGIINTTVKELNDVVSSKEFRNFYSEKAFMIQLLPPRSNQDIDAILEGQTSLMNIFIGMQKIVVQEVFEEIFKRQKLYFNRFIEQLDQVQDEDIGDSGKFNSEKKIAIYKDIRQKQKKYLQQEAEWKRQLDLKLKDILNRIRNQFLKKGQFQAEIKADKKSDLFSQKYFQVLKLKYFQHQKILGSFVRLDHIIAYQEIVKQNRLKNILLDFQAQITKKSSKQPQTSNLKRTKVSCCGIFRKTKPTTQQSNVIKKVKNNKQIDYYTCALKDGYMLYQGHITLYEDYLRFKSSFNPSTFFGSTDIIIPKFDIYQFIRGRHIVSLLITVVTKRGSLEFTSFFSTDPFDLLVQVYMSNRNTEYEIATHQPLLDPENAPRPQLQQLKLKMQKQFGEIAAKQQFKVTKVNVTDRINEIQIEYMYIDQSSQSKNPSQNQLQIPYNFRVTIKQYENSLEYVFWHCVNQTLPRKKKLQTIAKNLIKEDRVQKFDNFTREIRERERGNMDDNISFNMGEQFSIIGEKEKHRIDIGFYQPINPIPPDSTKSRKNISVDWVNLIHNQTKNNSNFFAPETHKDYSRKQTKKQEISSKNINPQKYPQKLAQNPQKVLNTSQKSSKQNTKNHNSINHLKTSQSVIVSQNASTVKLTNPNHNHNYSYNPKHSGQSTQRKILRSSQVEEIRSQGMKNLVYLIGLALGVIFVIRLFM